MCDGFTTSQRCMMDTQFNVFEILRIAEEVETKAAKFYLRAAERFADENRRILYYRLADWRVRHRDHWRRIRHQYSEQTGEFGTFDPDNYVLSNPQSMADLTGFGTDPNGRGRPTGCETEKQIIHDAIRRSEGIIIFYHGLKDFAQGTESHMMIDNMIREEDRHGRLLGDSLEQMETLTDDEATQKPCTPPTQRYLPNALLIS
jgi:rubrerythrin